MGQQADIPDLLAAVDDHGVDTVVWVEPDRAPRPTGRVVDHPSRRVLLGVAGSHRIRACDGAEVVLRLGTAVIFAPGTWHVIESCSARSYLSAMCSDHDLRFFRRHHDGVHEPGDLRTWVRSADASVLRLLDVLESVAVADRPVVVRALVRLLWRAAVSAPRPGGAEATWQRLLAYCEEEWDHDLGRDAAARACGIDPAWVTALFRRFAGTTFQDWLTGRRMDEARRLLVDRPGLAVGEVGRACGYADARYFRRMFRRRFGVAPSRMRGT